MPLLWGPKTLYLITGKLSFFNKRNCRLDLTFVLRSQDWGFQIFHWYWGESKVHGVLWVWLGSFQKSFPALGPQGSGVLG